MNYIKVKITGTPGPVGKTQLANHLRAAIAAFRPQGVGAVSVRLVDDSIVCHTSTFVGDSGGSPEPGVFQKIRDAGLPCNLSKEILAAIAKAHDGRDPERNGFAQDIALQYGFTYLDDDAELIGATADRFVDLFAVFEEQIGELKAELLQYREKPAAQAPKTDHDDLDKLLVAFGHAAYNLNGGFLTDLPEFKAVRRAVENYRYSKFADYCLADVKAAGEAIPLAQPRTTSFVTGARVLAGYEGLAAILGEALNQAQTGKGAERHNLKGDVPFEKQRMQLISELIGSPDGMTYQACKKITEGVELPTLDRQVAELLGAINYIAGMIVFLRGKAAKSDAVAEVAKFVDGAQMFDRVGSFDPNLAREIAEAGRTAGEEVRKKLAEQTTATESDPDECPANGQSCVIQPDGPNGERQCVHCGSDDPEPKAAPSKDDARRALREVTFYRGSGVSHDILRRFKVPRASALPAALIPEFINACHAAVPDQTPHPDDI